MNKKSLWIGLMLVMFLPIVFAGNFTITAKDSYTNASISNFTVNMTGNILYITNQSSYTYIPVVNTPASIINESASRDKDISTRTDINLFTGYSVTNISLVWSKPKGLDKVDSALWWIYFFTGNDSTYLPRACLDAFTTNISTMIVVDYDSGLPPYTAHYSFRCFNGTDYQEILFKNVSNTAIKELGTMSIIGNYSFSTATSSVVTDLDNNYSNTFSNYVNLAFNNSEYFANSYTAVNTTSNFTANLSQSAITFYAIPKGGFQQLPNVTISTPYLSTVVVGSIGSQYKTTHYMQAGTYNVTASKPGYYNNTVQVTVTPLQVTSVAINLSNILLNLSTKNTVNSSAIQNFSGALTYSIRNGFVDTNSTASGNLQMYTASDNFSLEFSAPGYFNNTVLLNLSSFSGVYNYTSNLYPAGTQQIFVYSTNGSLITGTVNLTMSNSTNQLNFTITGGTANITGLSPGSTYNMLFASAGYAQQTFVYSYPVTTPNNFTAFLSPATTPITFSVQDTSAGNPKLNKVLVTIRQFVGGTFQTVGSGYTDATGTLIINAFQNVQTQTIFTLDGYASLELDNTLSQNAYTVSMSSVNRYSSENAINSFVSYSYQPTANDLNYNQTMMFNLTVTPTGTAALEYFNLTLLTVNGGFIAQANSSNSSGGSLNLSLNLVPYNGSQIKAVYVFKRKDYGTFTVAVVYNVADIAYTGTPAELRQWIQTNMSLGWRVFFWFFLSLCLVLGFRALGISGLMLGGIGIGCLCGFGYLFVMSDLILTVIGTVGAIVFILGVLGA